MERKSTVSTLSSICRNYVVLEDKRAKKQRFHACHEETMFERALYGHTAGWLWKRNACATSGALRRPPTRSCRN